MHILYYRSQTVVNFGFTVELVQFYQYLRLVQVERHHFIYFVYNVKRSG